MKPALIVWLVSLPLAAADVAADRLLAEVSRLAKISDGVVGLSASHIETGRDIAYHASDRFPMASTFKVPVAVQLLARVDRGEIRLEQMIDIHPRDLHPGSGTLHDLFKQPGLALSLRNLLELMLLISDNSATDLVLRQAGGPEAVTARMRELGITGITVNRPTVNLIADWVGAKLPPETDWTPDIFGKVV